MYYETDGDSGYYHIKLFSSETLAEAYKRWKDDSYGGIAQVEVDSKEEIKMAIEETLCPECNSKMISRKGQFGIFWGCSNFPKCKGTRDSMGRSKAERDAERNSSGNSHDESSTLNERASENDKFRFRKDG